jgi:hypothetical protein
MGLDIERWVWISDQDMGLDFRSKTVPLRGDVVDVGVGMKKGFKNPF